MTDTARRKPIEAAAKDAACLDELPFRAAPQPEAEQGAARRHPRQQRGARPGVRLPEPHHFYDPLHQQIYETAAKLIAVGKQATPITLKTFFENAEPIDATPTVSQYLAGRQPMRPPSSTHATTAARSTTSPPAAS
jgi:replicative DNA helicase